MATGNPMQIGVVGLGRMGANILRRLTGDGHVRRLRRGPRGSKGA